MQLACRRPYPLGPGRRLILCCGGRLASAATTAFRAAVFVSGINAGLEPRAAAGLARSPGCVPVRPSGAAAGADGLPAGWMQFKQIR